MIQDSRKAIVALMGCAALVTGCGPEAPPPPQQAQPSAETFEKFGNYELHFNAIRADELLPEMAQRYGIERSPKRVLLTVAVLHRAAEGALATPVESVVTASVRTLSSPATDVAIRPISEGTSISYIGEVPLGARGILVFDINATAAGESRPVAATFQREFFVE